MKYNKKQMSEDLRQKLWEQRMTLDEARKKIKVSKPTLSRVQNGHQPELITYAKVCKFLGVSLDYYITK